MSNPGKTHWETCWQVHTECKSHRINEIEKGLRDALGIVEQYRAHLQKCDSTKHGYAVEIDEGIDREEKLLAALREIVALRYCDCHRIDINRSLDDIDNALEEPE